jgi:hypothetical protein
MIGQAPTSPFPVWPRLPYDCVGYVENQAVIFALKVISPTKITQDIGHFTLHRGIEGGGCRRQIWIAKQTDHSQIHGYEKAHSAYLHTPIGRLLQAGYAAAGRNRYCPASALRN